MAPTVSYASAASITVTNVNGISDIVKVDLKPFQPALFRLAEEYVAAVCAYGVVASASIAGLTSAPAQPGASILVYGTG